MLSKEEGDTNFEEGFAIVGDGNGTGNIVWKPDPNGVPFLAGASIKSLTRWRSKECESMILPNISNRFIASAIQIIDLDSIFTAPFKLQQDVAP